jgi:hypothetical protein
MPFGHTYLTHRSGHLSKLAMSVVEKLKQKRDIIVSRSASFERTYLTHRSDLLSKLAMSVIE